MTCLSVFVSCICGGAGCQSKGATNSFAEASERCGPYSERAGTFVPARSCTQREVMSYVVSYAFLGKRRRSDRARPIRPVPKSAIEPGSGTDVFVMSVLIAV